MMEELCPNVARVFPPVTLNQPRANPLLMLLDVGRSRSADATAGVASRAAPAAARARPRERPRVMRFK